MVVIAPRNVSKDQYMTGIEHFFLSITKWPVWTLVELYMGMYLTNDVHTRVSAVIRRADMCLRPIQQRKCCFTGGTHMLNN